jgi:hypothetical protein
MLKTQRSGFTFLVKPQLGMVFKLNFVLNDEHNLFKSDVIYSISEVKCNLFERDIYVRLMKLWIFKHI